MWFIHNWVTRGFQWMAYWWVLGHITCHIQAQACLCNKHWFDMPKRLTRDVFQSNWPEWTNSHQHTMRGGWTWNTFPSGFGSLVDHGGLQFVFLLPSCKQPTSTYQLINNLRASTYLPTYLQTYLLNRGRGSEFFYKTWYQVKPNINPVVSIQLEFIHYRVIMDFQWMVCDGCKFTSSPSFNLHTQKDMMWSMAISEAFQMHNHLNFTSKKHRRP